MGLDESSLPLLIQFSSGTSVQQEPAVTPKLPIIQNGPPATRVKFSDGTQVHLPTDQVVFVGQEGDSARVGFGGMSFDGVEDGRLVFNRVRDLVREELLSPERAQKMTLEPVMVSSIHVDGRHVWPLGSSSSR